MKRRILSAGFLSIAFIGLAGTELLRIIDLKCEFIEQSQNVANESVGFSWRLASDLYEVKQKSFKISISDSDRSLIATTGWVNSASQSYRMGVSGLRPNSVYYYMVEIADSKGNKTSSDPNRHFSTGLKGLMAGEWISDGLDQDARQTSVFVKEFINSKAVRKGTLHIASAGFHDVKINTVRISDFLSPSITDFAEKIFYKSYDITQHLNLNANTIEVTLGNGWFNFQPQVAIRYDLADWRQRPCFTADMVIEYEDGTSELILTNETWSYKTSPIRSNNVYTGESYDQNAELNNSLSSARVTTSPTKRVEREFIEPLKLEPVEPSELTKISENNYLFRFPVNFSGYASLNVPAVDQARITISYGERLTNGHVDNSHFGHYYSSSDPDAQFQSDYVFTKTGNFQFSPIFSYKGFQYVEVLSDKPIDLDLTSVEGYFVHTDMKRIGQIHSGDTLLNQIYDILIRSYLSNAVGFFTDCPQREKNGWTGDAHIAMEVGMFNFDSKLLYLKFMEDHVDAQLASGSIPMIVPSPDWGYDNATFDWTYSTIAIPWNLYLFTGDKSVITRFYPTMRTFLKHWDGLVVDEYLMASSLGDWQEFEERSSITVLSSMIYFNACKEFSRMAAAVSANQDSKFYYERSLKIKEKVNQKYFRDSLAARTTTELSLALFYHIIDDALVDDAVSALERKIYENDYKLTTGVLGTKALFRVLSDHGLENSAYRIATQTERPSYGYLIANGATTLPEGMFFGSDYKGSRNHAYFGTISDWFYRDLGGINPDERDPGFSNVLIKPVFPEGLESFKAELNSVRGVISSDWRNNQDFVIHHVTIPTGSMCEYQIPKSHALHHFNISTPNKELSAVEFDRNSNLIKLGSGAYTITLSANKLFPVVKEILVEGENKGSLAVLSDKGQSRGYRLSYDGSDTTIDEEYQIISFSKPGLFSIAHDSLIVNVDLAKGQLNEDEVIVLRCKSSVDSVADKILSVVINPDQARNEGSSKVKIYPNPSEDFILLELEKSTPIFLNYRVTRLDGRILSEGLLNQLGGVPKVDISRLSPGLYVLTIPELGESSSFVRK